MEKMIQMSAKDLFPERFVLLKKRYFIQQGVEEGQPMPMTRFADFLGISAQAARQYASGERLPNVEFLETMARKCRVSTDWLIGVQEHPRVQWNDEFVADYMNTSVMAIYNLRRFFTKYISTLTDGLTLILESENMDMLIHTILECIEEQEERASLVKKFGKLRRQQPDNGLSNDDIDYVIGQIYGNSGDLSDPVVDVKAETKDQLLAYINRIRVEKEMKLARVQGRKNDGDTETGI